MRRLLTRFASAASGATAIEYGLIAALVACLVVSGVGLIGTNLASKFKATATAVGSTATAGT